MNAQHARKTERRPIDVIGNICSGNVDGRLRQTKMAPPRTGHHPREPRSRGTAEPTQEATHRDLPADGDGTATPPLDEPLAEGGHESPSYSPDSDDDKPLAPSPQKRYQSKSKPSEPRFTTTGAGDADPADWTRFDINVSLKNLRSNDPRVVRNELRKLHLRWWHASEPKMHKILRGAGIEPKRLSMIKGIVDTCRECRAWARPGNTVLPSVKLPTKFNESIQGDVHFYKGETYKGFHVIDE